VVHYLLQVPEDVSAPVTVEVRLQYRKFDTAYMKHVYGKEFVNDLPIMTLAEDRVTFPVLGGEAEVKNAPSAIPEWQRWNDYGIGLLLKGGKTKGEQPLLDVRAFEVVRNLPIDPGLPQRHPQHGAI